jgi:hypothetical protein
MDMGLALAAGNPGKPGSYVVKYSDSALRIAEKNR